MRLGTKIYWERGKWLYWWTRLRKQDWDGLGMWRGVQRLQLGVSRYKSLVVVGLRRGRGRPKKNWGEVIRQDMKHLQLMEDMTLDKGAWRSSYRVVCSRMISLFSMGEFDSCWSTFCSLLLVNTINIVLLLSFVILALGACLQLREEFFNHPKRCHTISCSWYS